MKQNKYRKTDTNHHNTSNKYSEQSIVRHSEILCESFRQVISTEIKTHTFISIRFIFLKVQIMLDIHL
jgi:ribosomal protein S25